MWSEGLIKQLLTMRWLVVTFLYMLLVRNASSSWWCLSPTASTLLHRLGQSSVGLLNYSVLHNWCLINFSAILMFMFLSQWMTGLTGIWRDSMLLHHSGLIVCLVKWKSSSHNPWCCLWYRRWQLCGLGAVNVPYGDGGSSFSVATPPHCNRQRLRCLCGCHLPVSAHEQLSGLQGYAAIKPCALCRSLCALRCPFNTSTSENDQWEASRSACEHSQKQSSATVVWFGGRAFGIHKQGTNTSG